MVQENEIIMAVLSLGVLTFIYLNDVHLKRVEAFKFLYAGFCAFSAGWVLTVLENFFYESLLNSLEHMSYAVGAILVAVWCWKVFGRVKVNK